MVSSDTWQALEKIHRVVYPETHHADDYTKLGLDNVWLSYFAGRAAPLGRASVELTTATFFGFSPDRIVRYLPRAWEVTTPEEVLAARSSVAVRGLQVIEDQVGAVATSLIEALPGLTLAGAPMAAAQLALPVPERASEKLWYAATVLREFRGDRHWAVMAAAGLDGASANALATATGLQSAKMQFRYGWSDHDWEQAFADLATRGWVNDDRTATPEGITARKQLEDATDRVTLAGFDNELRARLIAAEIQLSSLAREVVL